MKLTDILTEEEKKQLSEAPGYVDTFDPLNRDFYLIKPDYVKLLSKNIIRSLSSFLNSNGTKNTKGLEELVANFINHAIEDEAIPNLHKSDFYKAALKDFQTLSKKDINQ
jgi:hypothetical protein